LQWFKTSRFRYLEVAGMSIDHRPMLTAIFQFKQTQLVRYQSLQNWPSQGERKYSVCLTKPNKTGQGSNIRGNTGSDGSLFACLLQTTLHFLKFPTTHRHTQRLCQ
jgi:hypothetical protein